MNAAAWNADDLATDRHESLAEQMIRIEGAANSKCAFMFTCNSNCGMRSLGTPIVPTAILCHVFHHRGSPRLRSVGSILMSLMLGSILECDVACSKSAMSPSPSDQVSIVISPSPDVIFVSQSVPLTAINIATGQPLVAAWSTGDSTVATVIDGTLKAVRPGVTTVSAIYKSSRSSFTLKVVPDFTGRYPGPGFVVACEDVVVGYCDFNVLQEKFGNSLPFNLSLTQTRDVVSGSLTVDSNEGPVQGSINSQGQLTLTGTLPDRIIPRVGSAAMIQSWATTLNESGSAMTGRFTMVTTRLDGSRLGVWTVELRTVPRLP